MKTRRTAALGPPELAVDRAKQARLVRAAVAWLAEHGGTSRRVRFDVVSCRAPGRPGDRWRIEHWPGAFDAGPT